MVPASAGRTENAWHAGAALCFADARSEYKDEMANVLVQLGRIISMNLRYHRHDTGST